METAIQIICYYVSCFVIMFIQFQFMDVRYLRTYNNRLIYWGSFICFTVIETIVNIQKIPLMNFTSWLIIVAITAIFLYYEENSKGVRRLVEAEAFMIAMGIEEAVFLILCELLLDAFNVNYGKTIMVTGPGAVLSKAIVIFVNYFLLKKFK